MQAQMRKCKPFYEKLYKCIERGCLNGVKSTFDGFPGIGKQGFVNNTDFNKLTVLQVAAKHDKVDILEYMYNQYTVGCHIRLNPDELITDVMNAYLIAMENKSTKAIEYLATKMGKDEEFVDFKFIQNLIDNNNIKLLQLRSKFGLKINYRMPNENKNIIETNLSLLCKSHKPKLEILKVFVSHGENFHEFDKTNSTLFNYVVENWSENRETLNYLIESEEYKKCDLQNKFLSLIPKNCTDETFDYLMGLNNFTEQEKIEALELFGAHRAFDDDMIGAEKSWVKAIDERKRLNLPKKILPAVEAFGYLKEFKTLKELNTKFKNNDDEAIRAHALLVHERLLGPCSHAAIEILSLKGQSLFGDGEFGQMYSCWLYSLEIQTKKFQPLSYTICDVFYRAADSFYSYQYALKVFIQNGEKRGINHFAQNFSEVKTAVLKVIGYMADHLTRFKQKTDVEPTSLQFYHVVYFVAAITELLNLPKQCEKFSKWSDSEMVQIKDGLKKIIELNLRVNSQSLFHLAIQTHTYRGLNYMNENFAITVKGIGREDFVLNLVKMLLECGANPNDLDEQHKTPLHYTAEMIVELDAMLWNHKDYDDITFIKNGEQSDIIDLMLKYGAHADILDNRGRTPYTTFKLVRYDLKALKPENCINLQCLAASTVQEHKIEYESKLPKHLHGFISSHKHFENTGTIFDEFLTKFESYTGHEQESDDESEDKCTNGHVHGNELELECNIM